LLFYVVLIQRAARARSSARAGGVRAIEDDPHAQCFGPLDGHQPHLPADVVAVHQLGNLRFVELGVLLQARNLLFDIVAKPGADLKIFIDSTIGHHGVLLGEIFSLERTILKRDKVFSSYANLNEELQATPDYA
jgi:hypothetical protein